MGVVFSVLVFCIFVLGASQLSFVAHDDENLLGVSYLLYCFLNRF